MARRGKKIIQSKKDSPALASTGGKQMFGLSEAHALLCPASVMATLSITDILLGKCLIFGLLLGDRGHLWMSKRSNEQNTDD